MDAVSAFFIFLHLLEGQAERLGECGLGHAKLCATRAQLHPHMLVSWVCYVSWHRALVSLTEGHIRAEMSADKGASRPRKRSAAIFGLFARRRHERTFKFAGLRQAPLAALPRGYTTLPCVWKGDA